MMHTPPLPISSFKNIVGHKKDMVETKMVELLGYDQSNAILNGDQPISHEAAEIFESFDISTAGCWMRVQDNYDNAQVLPGYNFRTVREFRVIDLQTGEVVMETPSFYLFFKATNDLGDDRLGDSGLDEGIQFEVVLKDGSGVVLNEHSINFQQELVESVTSPVMEMARTAEDHFYLKDQDTPLYSTWRVKNFALYNENLMDVVKIATDFHEAKEVIVNLGEVGNTEGVSVSLVGVGELEKDFSREEVYSYKTFVSERLMESRADADVFVRINNITEELYFFYVFEDPEEAEFEPITGAK